MSGFFYLIPLSLALGAIGLGVFLWSLRNGQYEDLDGAAERILFDDEDGAPRAEPIAAERDRMPGSTSGARSATR